MKKRGSLFSMKAAAVAMAAAIASACMPSLAQDLEIHCIDVGQGSCELIIGPSGTTILIDGGTSVMGQNRVLPYLNGIFPPGDRTLDYVICSHDHKDHYGGLNYILSNGYSASKVYHSGYNSSFGRGQPIPVGLTIDLGGGAFATCVLAYGQMEDGGYVSPTSDKNTHSIALLVENGGFDYITAGDLTSRTEDDLAEMLVNYVNPPDHPHHPNDTYLDPGNGVDIIHVNHHGSKGSSCADYVNLLRCEVAVVPGGTSYGHPHRNAIDRLLARQTYSIDCSCSGGSSFCGRSTGITVPGAAVYRTTGGGYDCRRSPEPDCPVAGDILIISDGSSGYIIEGTYLDPAYRESDEQGGSRDSDGDGLSDEEEGVLQTDPYDHDSDDDGYPDRLEVLCGSAMMALDFNLHPEKIRISFQGDDSEIPPSPCTTAGEEGFKIELGYGWD